MVPKTRLGHGHDKSHDRGGKARVNRSRLGSQVIDHVLIVLREAGASVQRLAVVGEPDSVGAVSHVKILRANPPDDPGWAHFHTIRLRRQQRSGTGRWQDWNSPKHLSQ